MAPLSVLKIGFQTVFFCLWKTSIIVTILKYPGQEKNLINRIIYRDYGGSAGGWAAPRLGRGLWNLWM